MIKFNKRKCGDLFKHLYLFKPVNLTSARNKNFIKENAEISLKIFKPVNLILARDDSI